MPVYIPSEYGSVGDIYIDTLSGGFYGPKTIDGWPDQPSFIALTDASVDAAGLNDRLIHTQGAASTTWVINHDLGGRPSVTVVDSGGTVCIGTVVYNSDTQVTVNFTVPFSGFAYLT